MSTPEITLEPARLIAIAEQQTGLEDWGPEPFRAALDQLCCSLRDEARLNAAGQYTHSVRLQDILATRLRLQQFMTRFPEIRDENISQPLIIVGLPRTGTTMLQRMIAADPAFHSTRWWETRFPLPFDNNSSPEDVRARIERGTAEVDMMLETVPELAAIHPLSATEADEEIMLLEQSLLSTTPESMARVPGYAAWQQSQDQVPAYRYLKQLLQCLQWQKRQRGETADRWVLKTPHHLHCMDALFQVFPDAQIVQTHRDPLETIPSMASFCYALHRLGSDEVDAIEVGQHWSEKMRSGLQQCMQVRETGFESRFVDIDFNLTLSDPLGAVARIFEAIQQPFVAQTAEAVASWVAANQRDRRPPHRYTAEQFGLSEAQLNADFAFYRARFVR